MGKIFSKIHRVISLWTELIYSSVVRKIITEEGSDQELIQSHSELRPQYPKGEKSQYEGDSKQMKQVMNLVLSQKGGDSGIQTQLERETYLMGKRIRTANKTEGTTVKHRLGTVIFKSLVD